MDGLLISLVLVALLVLALQPAHNRSWRPGFDSRVDRDQARQHDELRLLSTFEPLDPAEHHRSGRTLHPGVEPSTGTEAPDEERPGRAA